MNHDVFICYDSADRAYADAVCAALEVNSIKCWIAPRDILPGMHYAEAILRAINECRLMVMIFSAESNTSEHVKNEVERAVSKKKAIILFRVEDVFPSGDLELYLYRRHWLDALTPPLEQHLKTLVDTVQLLLRQSEAEQESIPPPTPPQHADHLDRTAHRRGVGTAIAAVVVCIIASLILIPRVVKRAELPTGTEGFFPGPIDTSGIDFPPGVSPGLDARETIRDSTRKRERYFENTVAVLPAEHLPDSMQDTMEKAALGTDTEIDGEDMEQRLEEAETAYRRKDYRSSIELAENVLASDPYNTRARKIATSASIKIAPVQINDIVTQYVQSLNDEDLPPFYERNCCPQLLPRMKKEAEIISKLYRDFRSVASDINIRFIETNMAEVSFSNIITGTSIEGETKRVLFEGMVKWDMEKQGKRWVIKSIRTRPREEK